MRRTSALKTVPADADKNVNIAKEGEAAYPYVLISVHPTGALPNA